MVKTILITGSTDGIGKLAAINLAKEGHVVYLHGRQKEKLERLISEIKEISGNSNIDGFVADFSDLNAVRRMAKEVIYKLETLDILINNAGIFNSPIDHVDQGDIRFVVNYFAPFLLTNDVLKLLQKSNDSRIINLSSAAQTEVNFEALNGKVTLTANEAYAQSKLALTMWSFYLAEQLKTTSVIAVNPGSLLNTRMANEAYGQHWSPATKGSDILYELAVSKEYDRKTGLYFDNDKGNPKGAFAKAHPDAYDDVKIEKLMHFTEQFLKIE